MQRTIKPAVSNQPSPDIVRKNRVYFILGAILVLGIGGMFAWNTERALYVRSITGSVFANYVIQHRIGHATITDDASGFQGDFCVLTLNRPFPSKRLQQDAESMAFQYYSLDGGTSLTIQYDDSATHKAIIQASSLYMTGPRLLRMNLRTGSNTNQVTEKVNWPDNGTSS